jgi:hypothetical protein
MTVTERDQPARWPVKPVAHPGATRAVPAQTVALFQAWRTHIPNFEYSELRFRNTAPHPEPLEGSL